MLTAWNAFANLNRMLRLKQFFTPAGALAMIVGLWLPWADVRCAQIRTEPDFWQLANYDERMYLLLVPVLVIALCGAWSLRTSRKSITTAIAAGALAAVAAWVYLWIRKDEVAAYQAQLATGGGDLARMARDLQVYLGMGFKLYLGGAVVALAIALFDFSRRESDSPK